MGLISGFLGGYGEGLAKVKMQEIEDQSQREIAEANWAKQESLARLNRESQESIHEADRLSRESEGQAGRESAERIAGMKEKSSANDSRRKALDVAFWESMDKLDEMEASGGYDQSVITARRNSLRKRYYKMIGEDMPEDLLNEPDTGDMSGGIVGAAKGGSKAETPEKKSKGLTVGEYESWLKQNFAGISDDEIKRQVEINKDRLTDYKPAYGAATAPGGRKAMREQTQQRESSARAIAQGEYSNELQTMSGAEAKAWLAKNQEYLTLEQVKRVKEMIRGGSPLAGRN